MANTILNKTLSIPASEEEVWAWREAAVRERKSFALWARERLNAGLGKREKPEVRKLAPVEVSEKVKELAEIKAGIPEEFEEPKKLETHNTGETAEEKLKRIKEAGKGIEKRWGK